MEDFVSGVAVAGCGLVAAVADSAASAAASADAEDGLRATTLADVRPGVRSSTATTTCEQGRKFS